MDMKKIELDKFKNLEVIATLSFFLFLIGFVFKNSSFSLIALILLFLGLFVPKISKHVSLLWLKFGFALGLINTNFLLGIIFFIVLSPIAFLYRLLRKDFLDISKNGIDRTSTWKKKDYLFSKENLEKMW